MPRKTFNRRRAGFTLIELLIVVAIVLILLAVGLPNMGKTRMHAQEMNAIRQVNTIHTAQTQYFSQFGKFAENLAQLGPPKDGTAGPAAADLISGDLAEGEKTGYKFIVNGTKEGYSVNANPSTFNTTGRRTFYSDQTLIIRQNWSAEPANEKSPEIK
jgi:type IV pilus assembly protein PilA